MAENIRIAFAQTNFLVGDVVYNTQLVTEKLDEAAQLECDLVIFPELCLTGYPPEDLLFHRGVRAMVEVAVASLAKVSHRVAFVLGYPHYQGDEIYNAAGFFYGGHEVETYHKHVLPNYGVFDEKRYFTAGSQATVVEFKGAKLGLTVCEDIWSPEPTQLSVAAGAEFVININASPFSFNKQSLREKTVKKRAIENARPILYVNLYGGQDELIFDGGSMIVDGSGEVVHRDAAFAESFSVVEWQADERRFSSTEVTPLQGLTESTYRALVAGTQEYVEKNNFPGVIIGLSGGIDSALVTAIAVDALGAKRVEVVLMPSRYTSQISVDDAEALAERLGVRHRSISIEPAFQAMLDSMRPVFEGLPEDHTEENLQARCRGMILMALSNKTGNMVLTTGNKSEMAVGYSTLYGDMAGGFAPIKDLSKTQVYKLARYRNSISGDIPERIITRAPTAELRPDQKDTDSLPPYEILDPILEAFIEEDCSVEEIVLRGYDKAIVVRVLKMLMRNEYKRRQAPPGVRVSPRAFGRDWRYPITSGYTVD